METKLIIFAFTACFSFALISLQHLQAAEATEPNAKVVAKLSEIVQVREQLATHFRNLYEAGEATAENVNQMWLAEIDLAEARVNLAREKNLKEELVKALQGLVAVHEQRAERAKSRLNDNSSNRAKVAAERAQAELLEAQVRLLREQG